MALKSGSWQVARGAGEGFHFLGALATPRMGGLIGILSRPPFSLSLPRCFDVDSPIVNEEPIVNE